MATRRPLRYRGLSDARIKQLQPVFAAVRRLIRYALLNDAHHHS